MPSYINLNTISPDLRDALLKKNLTLPKFQSLANGGAGTAIGYPYVVPEAKDVVNVEDITDKLPEYLNINYNLNKYQGDVKSLSFVGDSIFSNIKPSEAKIDGSYLDEDGKLNLRGNKIVSTLNTVTSALNGQIGFNIGSDGKLDVVNNNDIRNTIVGRALAATGVIEDSELGIIGAKQLAITLANYTLFKAEKWAVKEVKNTLDGIFKNDLLVYNTNRWTNKKGSRFDIDYFNFKTPGNGGNSGGNISSTLSDFVWTDENFNNDQNGVGDGDLLKQSEIIFKNDQDVFSQAWNYLFIDGDFFPNRKSILKKTKEMFETNKVHTLVNGHGIDVSNIEQIQSAVVKKPGSTDTYMMSKGNAALTKDALDGTFDSYSKVYCRTWTPMDKYDEVYDLVRHSGLYNDGGDYIRRKFTSFSVLENTGFVHIANYLKESAKEINTYMFSLENLAYRDITNLPDCEQGPNGGRIMWFPPYDIKFSESTSVNWDKHNFIGRGEPMYTYNNSERTGQLSFKVIIDHPNHLNVKDSNILKSNDHYASFFAGCNEPDAMKEPDPIIDPEPEEEEEIIEKPKEIEPSQFAVFYPNDDADYPFENPQYESGLIDTTPEAIKNIRFIDKDKSNNTNDLVDYVKYNKLMGKYPPVNPNIPKQFGPISPLLSSLTGSTYESKCIDYNKYPGISLNSGLGVVNIKNPVVGHTKVYIDRTNFGLNANRHDSTEKYENQDFGNLLNIPNKGKWTGWLARVGKDSSGNRIDQSYLEALKEHMDGDCKDCIINVYGFASTQGDSSAKNLKLSKKRVNSTIKYLREALFNNDPKKINRIVEAVGRGITSDFNKYATFLDTNGKYSSGDCVDDETPQDTLGCKLNRRVIVQFELTTPATQKTTSKKNTKTEPIIVEKKLEESLYKECSYFQRIKQSDPFTYSKLSDRIKFFSPAFHSTTPEGFNSRLTFLNECTRQGPSIYTDKSNANNASINKPGNLAFGRPPVCVLRVGDFYHTKIIIESLSIDYEPLVWDLNPEGVGVQPMIANVSMNFAFIGGSSLGGPISVLQNAISRNYYANTGLFDKNADFFGSASALIRASKEKPSIIDKEQTVTTHPKIDDKLKQKEEDLKKLQDGVLVLKYDNSGLFQGKIKGMFKLKEDVSKTYDIRLRFENSDITNYNYDFNETISLEKLKSVDSVRFESKRTTRENIKWAEFLSQKFVFSKLYLAQNELNEYVKFNVNENEDPDKDKGWDFIQYLKFSVSINDTVKRVETLNFKAIIEVDELNFKKEFKVIWVPEYKSEVKIKDEYIKTNTIAGMVGSTPIYEYDTKKAYSYEAYISGGYLQMVNDNNDNADADAENVTKEGNTKRQTRKNTKALNKLDKQKEKQAKKAEKDALKAKKAIDSGKLESSSELKTNINNIFNTINNFGKKKY